VGHGGGARAHHVQPAGAQGGSGRGGSGGHERASLRLYACPSAPPPPFPNSRMHNTQLGVAVGVAVVLVGVVEGDERTMHSSTPGLAGSCQPGHTSQPAPLRWRSTY
jgi:hypothetical protein